MIQMPLCPGEGVVPIVRRKGTIPTRPGLPALWEWGGGYQNIGIAQIITDHSGQPLRPIYIRYKGTLANKNHALVAIRPGYYIVLADQLAGEYSVHVFRISLIRKKQAVIERVAYHTDGRWVLPVDDFLLPAVQAAMEKAACYHCREPHYVKRGI
jgi:hypothetical protein